MLPHEEQSGRFLRRPQQDYPAATVAEFCTAVLITSGSMPTVGLALSSGGPCGQSQSGTWLSSCGLVSFDHGVGRQTFSHRGTIEFDPVSVMGEPFEDRIREGRIADHVVPLFHRKLIGDDCCLAAMTIIHDLHQVALLTGGHRFWAPIIKE